MDSVNGDTKFTPRRSRFADASSRRRGQLSNAARVDMQAATSARAFAKQAHKGIYAKGTDPWRDAGFPS